MTSIILIQPGENAQQFQRPLEDFALWLSEQDVQVDNQQPTAETVAALIDTVITQRVQEFFDTQLTGRLHVNRTPMGDIVVSREYKFGQ